MSAKPETGRIVCGDRAVTLDDFHARTARAATGLSALGLTAGDTVALLLRNEIEFLEATFAAASLGCYPVPINWHFHAEEVAYVLDNSGARVLVAHDALLRQCESVIAEDIHILEVPSTAGLIAAYGAPGRPAKRRSPDWSEWLQTFGPLASPERNPPGAMLYTGGTTGHPKGVRYAPPTAQQTEAMAAMRAGVFGHRSGMRTVMCAPLYHSAPFSYTQGAVRQSGEVHLLPRFDAEALLATIARERISHLYAVPTMFVRLLRLPEAVRTRYDVSSLEWVIHAAAPCAPEVKRQMIEWFGPVVHEAYAATETGWLTCCDSAEAMAHPGTVGRVIEGAQVRIFSEDGAPAEVGEAGEIFGRHRSMPDFTYYKQDDKRREIERDGLVTAGDIGYFDAGGYLYLCDRRIDMIISGGVNIYPAEIEAALIAMADIHDCAVFGVPDDEFGERVAAAVQLAEGAGTTETDIREFLKDRIAGYKIPRVIEFVGEIPRLDSGKLLKRKLRDPYWVGRDRSI
ncbi:MAG: AMP-binding protein [Pseudomonadota bacterium]